MEFCETVMQKEEDERARERGLIPAGEVLIPPNIDDSDEES